jgi:hypothetical protein
VSSGSFKQIPYRKIKLNIDVADLEKLNLHAGPMKIRGVLDADIQSVDLDLNGKFSLPISPLPMKEQFIMDSITMIATSTADKNTLFFKSIFLNAEIEEIQVDNNTPSLTRSLLIIPYFFP